MPLILGTNSIKDTGYDVANSLRFNTASSDFLNRTHGTNSSAVGKFTFSFWFKRGIIETEQVLTTAFVDGNNVALIRINANNTLEVYDYQSSYKLRKITNRVFRDVSAWYHIVVEVDTTQGTASNRFKLYVSGVQETSFSTDTNYSQNDATFFNKNVPNFIGKINTGSPAYFNGYMAEFCFIDGTAYDEENFGEFDEDSPTIWKPKNVSGLTFGSNGFYLDFEDSSALGNDVSGNNNDFTVNNLTAVDQSTDTCTNNFATLSPLASGYYSSATFSEGNLKIVSQTYASIVSTIAVSQGKWYAEMRSTDISAGTGFMGITSNLPTASNYEAYNQSGSIVGYGVAGNGYAYGNGGGFGSWGGWSNNAIIMMAVDLDNNKLYWGVDGTWGSSSNPSTNTNGGSITPASSTTQGVYWFFCNSQTNDNATLEYNFGSPPYAISSGNADGNGYGNFEHTVPTNYYSLCTKNLSEYG